MSSLTMIFTTIARLLVADLECKCILYGAGRSNVLSNLNESRTVFGVWLKWIWLYLSSDFCLWSSIPLRDIAASWVHTMPGRKNLFHEVAWHLAWMLISWPPFIFFSLFLSCATVLALKVVRLTNIFLPHNSSLRARDVQRPCLDENSSAHVSRKENIACMVY